MRLERLKLELARSRRGALAVLALIACALVSLGIIFRNQTLFQAPWSDRYQVRAAFASGKGVVPGQHEVRVSGVQVGLVDDVDLVGGRAVITLALEPEYAPVYRDASARLRPATLAEDLYVDLDRGTPRAGELGEDAVLPAARTENPVDIARVLSLFDADTRGYLSALLDGLGRGLEDNGRSLREAFATLAPFLTTAKRVTEALATRRERLRRVVSNLAGLTGVLSRRDRELTRLVRAGGTTLAELAENDDPLEETLRALPPTLGVIRDSFARLRRAEANLDPALVALRPVARRLRPGLGGLRRFGLDARPAFAALRPALEELRPLVARLGGTAPPLRSAFVSLEPLTPALDRVTALVPPCLEELETLLQTTPSVWKFGDAWGGFARADISFGLDSLGGLVEGDINLRRVPSCTEGDVD